MIELENRLQRLGAPTAREVLYFLGRYFKQASSLEEGGKDIFDDVFDRAPNELVRGEVLKLISDIEAELGSKAADFDDDTSDRVLDAITQAEDSLEEDYSDEELERASDIISKMRASQSGA